MRESTTLRRLRIPAHWRLVSFCFVVAGVAILFEGIATHTVGPSAEPRQALGGPAPLVHSRPILAASGSHLVSTQPSPGRRVALTFDDGPDPRWTPKIAAILRRNHVPATFFVIGSEAARHPDLVRLLSRDGNELGNHTFTHVALSNGSGWQRRLQLDLTEAAIVGITGHYTRLVRPPYSATPDAVTSQDERDLAALAGRRYLIVLANYDSQDWTRPGVAKIVQDASPPGRTGGIVMLHDGGANRSETVAARARLPLRDCLRACRPARERNRARSARMGAAPWHGLRRRGALRVPACANASGDGWTGRPPLCRSCRARAQPRRLPASRHSAAPTLACVPTAR